MTKRMYCKAGICAAIGAVLLLTGWLLQKTDALVMTYGAALVAVGIAWFVRQRRLARDPEKMKAFQMRQSEERLVAIAVHSGHIAFAVSLVGELVAVIALSLAGRESAATAISLLVCAQTLVYLAVSVWYGKKH